MSNHLIVSDQNRSTDSRAQYSERKSVSFNNDPDSFMIGDRVWIQGIKPGYIVYIGMVEFAKGEWAGIVLDKPEGKNDGSVHGVRYFQCQPNRGLFTRLHRLSRYPIDVIDWNNNPIDVIKRNDSQKADYQTDSTYPYDDDSSQRTQSSSSDQTSIPISVENVSRKTHQTTSTMSSGGKITTTVTRVTKHCPANIPHYALPIKPTKVITTVTTTTTTSVEKPKSVLKNSGGGSQRNEKESQARTHHVHF
ncbi:hypothetical protein NH340_JMT03267 [Sarcoptes scabiei]|nr:hypothetical protein NH340_JMT03267 [Sarcoptes scabiei]